MDFSLPEELRIFQQSVRRFVDTELIPLEQTEPTGLLPATRDRLRALTREIGMWLLDVPEHLGGQGLSVLGQTIFWEEFSRSCATLPRDFYIIGPMPGAVLLQLKGELKERYLDPVIGGEKLPCFALTEPDAGTDPASMRTRAVRNGDHYVINGVKRFITDAEKADFAQLMALTDPSKGSRGVSCILVDMDTPGVKVARQIPTMMGEMPCEVFFDNVRVPVTNRIGEEGEGFRLAQQWITLGRILRHGARACGVAERCLEMGASYAKQRVTFGAPLASRQSIQWMLADTYTELQAARHMVRHAAWKLDQGEDARTESHIAKMYSVEMGFKAADRCMQIHGGIGLTTDLPVERFWRNQRPYLITEGAAEVMRMTVAR
ncbi:MAG: acyl-CoA dehydrogenase, partial [Betaproteobacteria bacterium RIFCSPLOWO2_12_FULL_66_14]